MHGRTEVFVQAKLELEIRPQPDDFTCGPTCLDSIYRYFDDELPLEQVIADVPQLDGGGTLAVYLACHALRRGYQATLYTYNLNIFDPTWFQLGDHEIAEKLRAQKKFKKALKLRRASEAYLEFLQRGGKLVFEDLTKELIRRHLDRGIPILTGLCSTYLYQTAREYGTESDEDDIRGEPAGHFVVLCGYEKDSKQILVADPLLANPYSGTNKYWINVDRVVNAILLGIVTYDGNMLVLEPGLKTEGT